GDEIEILESPETLVASVVFVRQEVEEPEVEDEDAEPGIVGEDEDEADGEGDDEASDDGE
ncbi:MAG: hypothetical protein R2681_15980, partial [Pyrinomonadaceae bacterium]